MLRTLISFMFFAIIIACASPNQTKTPEPQIDNGYTMQSERSTLSSGNIVRPNEERKSNETLGNMIAQVAGVEAFGDGIGMSFKVRGAESIYGNTDPLFVLNGKQIGTDFTAIAQVIDPNEVTSIRVLKGPDAAIYGTRGANGVILIRTKKP